MTLAAILAIVYVRTLLPSVDHTGDTAKFDFVGYVLGVPHEPGYPTWSHAVVAEVYTLAVLFMAVGIHFLVRWSQSRGDADLIAAVAIFAVSVGHSLTVYLLGPGLLVFVLATLLVRLLWREWWLLLPVAVYGAVRLGRAPLNLLLVLSAVCVVVFGLEYGSPDAEVMFIPFYFFVAIWVGVGLEGLARPCAGNGAEPPPSGCSSPSRLQPPICVQSRATTTAKAAEEALAAMPDGSVVFSPSFAQYMYFATTSSERGSKTGAGSTPTPTPARRCRWSPIAAARPRSISGQNAGSSARGSTYSYTANPSRLTSPEEGSSRAR